MNYANKPRLMIIGHARHGKDTFCEYLRDVGGYEFCSSSMFVMEKAVYPTLAPKYDYQTPEQCYADRANHRAEWYDLITTYNTPDHTRLARELYAQYPIYCGIRNGAELSVIKEQKVCDFVIWIDASRRLPPEDSSSMTVKQSQAHWTIDNNGPRSALLLSVEKFYHGFLAPWERRLADPSPALPNRATKVTP